MIFHYLDNKTNQIAVVALGFIEDLEPIKEATAKPTYVNITYAEIVESGRNESQMVARLYLIRKAVGVDCKIFIETPLA